MELRAVLNKERIRHKRQHRIRISELRQAPGIRRVVNCCQASGRPTGRFNGCGGELIDERLCITRAPRVTRGTKHESRDRCS